MMFTQAQRRAIRAVIDQRIADAPPRDKNRNKTKWLTVREHLLARAELADHYGVTVEDIDEAYRTRPIGRPRKVQTS